MDKLSIFLILSCLKQIIIAVNDNMVMCPALSVWEAHSETFCSEDPSMYHCLEDQTGELTEICIKPRAIEKGHYPVVSIDRKFLKSVKCPPTHFQPDGQMSNQYKKVTCMYLKSVCSDNGEEDCYEGSNVEDRTCRCDYTLDYRAAVYFLSNPANKPCYPPSSVEDGCIMMSCPKGMELNPAYQCVKKCPSGFHRRKYEFNCKEDESTQPTKQQNTSTKSPMISIVSEIPYTTKDPGNTKIQEKEETSGHDSSTLTAAAVGSGFAGAIFIFLIIISIAYILRKRNKHPVSETVINHGTYIENINIDSVNNLIAGEGTINDGESTERERVS